MCFSFNSAENRAAFLRDEDAYCGKFGLSEEQRAAVKSRSVLEMIEAGGNVYYLAKLAGIFGLNVQDIGAQQTGMSVDEFKAKLVAAAAADFEGPAVAAARSLSAVRSRTARESFASEGPRAVANFGIGTPEDNDHGQDHRRHRIDPRSRDRQGDRGEQAERSLLEAVLQGLRLRALLARAREAGRGGGVLQRPRPQLLSRQAADLRGRRGERIPQRGRGLGHPGLALGPGRSGPVLASDQCPGRRRVRHHHVPGHADRPRRDHPDDPDVAGRAAGR